MEVRGEGGDLINPNSVPNSIRRSETNFPISVPNQTLNPHQLKQQQQHQRVPDPDLALLTTAAPPPPSELGPAAAVTVRYRECLKNHAAGMGRHALDGCREFMAGGADGTAESLKCAACDCHRNFHRKESEDEESPRPPPNRFNPRNVAGNSSPMPKTHPNQARWSRGGGPVMLGFGGGAAAESSSGDLNVFRSNAGSQQQAMEGPSSGSRKRHRTKFSQNQKDRMLEFAEKLGWKLQKQDEEEIQNFCSELGVNRQVFKVWMHNNKQSMKKKHL